MLKTRGFAVVDADQLARDALMPGEPALNAILQRFGDVVLDGSGHLDRRALGRIVFDDAAARADLNAIVHPAVGLRSAMAFAELARDGHTMAFYDAALLFETGGHRKFPLVVVVAAPVELQLSRLAIRDPDLSVEDAKARIAAQMPLLEKVSLADIVIHNDSDLETLEQRVEQALVDIHGALSLPYRGHSDG